MSRVDWRAALSARFARVMLVAALSYGLPRFREPAEIPIVVLAGIGLVSALEWRRRQDGRLVGRRLTLR
jgi:hypothetical protein